MTGFQQGVSRLFNNNPDLRILRQMFSVNDLEAWLVGGTLRDLLLQRDIVDIDIATAGDPSELARKWARQISGRWFWLDEERCQSRVLTASGLSIDFAPLRAPTIEGDLSLRDFRINAMALSLNSDPGQAELLDPMAGQDDLRNNCLSFCTERSLHDDPLRMLKGIRHAVTLPVLLDEGSCKLINQQAALLGDVAGERIRDELGKIFSSPRATEGVALLQRCGLLRTLFGESQAAYQHELAVSALQCLQDSIDNIEIGASEEETRTEPFNSRGIFFLATFLRFYRPGDLSALLHKKFRLSRQQERLIVSLQIAPSETWYKLAATLPDSRRMALLVEQLGYFPEEQLLYWAIYEKKISTARGRELLSAYYNEQSLGRVPDLLDGHQLKELLQGQPLHKVGVWQKQLKQAELDGLINTPESACCWLEQQISD